MNIAQDAGMTVNAGSVLLSKKILSNRINHTYCKWPDTKTTPLHYLKYSGVYYCVI